MAPSPPQQLSLANLRALSVLGQGARGVVFHVVPVAAAAAGDISATAGADPMAMALKVMSRAAARHKGAGPGGTCGGDGHRRIWFERDVLLALRHPLLPSLRGVVATDAVVGFAIDRCPGGDLKSLRRRWRAETTFPERKSKKAAAAMVFACFSSRHAASPETSSSRSPPSVSMAASSASSSSCWSSGGARTPAKSTSFVGTEDYVAPEIVAGSGHDHAVDWWGLGVVLYEMLYGRTPFRGRSRRETFRRVLAAPPELPGEPTSLRDLIARLLEKDPRKRLGAHGVRRHAFFRGVDWDRVLDVARPPFIPAPDGDAGAEAPAEAEALDVEKVVHEVFGASGNGETPPTDVSSDGGRDYDFSIFF
ncbi:serine/threonine-protein kinase OXI1-like [Panicum miliaceum]|uniref:non-specific serine/threonine protein kinase n=1 Tax=Panicum miliaceum TaxID=4540 RepID=A0A3L6RVZ4_PANMI|nr:serine/threonine-protein kinase OXI1-like [Panicum miliaceum]